MKVTVDLGPIAAALGRWSAYSNATVVRQESTDSFGLKTWSNEDLPFGWRPTYAVLQSRVPTWRYPDRSAFCGCPVGCRVSSSFPMANDCIRFHTRRTPRHNLDCVFKERYRFIRCIV
jgi:hypothetical protein